MQSTVPITSVATRLRRFAEKPAPEERCELCSATLPAQHEHLVEPAARKILCVCGGCAVLFGYQAETKYGRVPRRIEKFANFRLTDAAWSGLGVPISLAFFFYNSAAGRIVAMYPSPAGATESLLSLDTWAELTADNRLLEKLAPDVEALLVDRVRPPHRYYRAPIDQCYTLVGIIRRYWRGFSGGSEAWAQIDRFFAELDERAEPLHELPPRREAALSPP